VNTPIETSPQPVLVERIGATAVLTLNRPRHRNALSADLRSRFSELLAELADDDSVRAIVLTGAGGHFCAGGDVKAMSEAQAGPRDVFEGRQRMQRMHRWFEQLVDMEKPVIAAIDGVAYGAGLSLATASDYVLCSQAASFCAVFSRIGYVPDLGAMYLLPRAIGLQRAKELVFSARVVDATEAAAIGLVQCVVPGGAEGLRAAALELAARFHHAPIGAIGIAKSVMNRAFESDRQSVYAQEALAQSLCRESAFHQEAVSRFIGKQPPLYQWPTESS
jgi:2-(1,2-epoxy-1,2-dihydrophenyl)acetyl-CoA isomerase